MLQREYRLLPHTSFAKATTTHDPFFVLKVVANTLSYNRYGFIVSKKISNNAVVRNTTRRLLRHCIEQNLSKIRTGYDMLFIATKAVTKEERDIACEHIFAKLKRMQLVL